MCDTIVALGNSTYDGSVIFGKNSDREPNEAHEVVIIPAAQHAAGSMVKCTYIEIPQVPQTFQVLLAKPFWIWGAEMGSNEHGVTIGNEAVFTKTPYEKRPGLIGMDFLRLALERAATANEALDLIIDLLEKYGQGGNCGFAHPMYYHNSFLICDFEDAWILETSGKDWAALKVVDVGSISNAITIGNRWERASKTLVSNAVKNRWCTSPADFDFARCYSEPVYTTFSDARRRQTCTINSLVSAKGSITPGMMMETLRSHTGDSDPEWSPDRGITGADVCMHAGWGPIRGSQTAGSMVSVLEKGEKPVHWVTGTAAPCTSVYKPIWLDAGMPHTGSRPGGVYDQAALYWRHEALHREVLRNYAQSIRIIRRDQKLFEDEFMVEVERNRNASPNRRRELSETAFTRAAEMEDQWHKAVSSNTQKSRNSLLYRIAWKKFNQEANME